MVNYLISVSFDTKTHRNNEAIMKLDRYNRQMLVNGFGKKGQKRLLDSKILVVGAGGLGAACLPYLAGAGVGHITIMDMDKVEISNLHRQVLYNENDVGMFKAKTAATKLATQNSQIKVTYLIDSIGAQNANILANEYDLIIDCTDNYNAKYAMNDACVAAQIPLVSASIEGMSGYLGVFAGKGMANYRGLFNEPALNALNCSDSGVLGSVAGIFGLMQAHEAIKYLSGVGEVIKHVIMLDLFDFSMQKIQVELDYQSTFKPFDIIHLNDIDQHQLLDVREISEFTLEHFNNAINWPLSYISDGLNGKENKPKPDDKLVLYCAKGIRAERAAIALQRSGYSQLALLSTGIV